MITVPNDLLAALRDGAYEAMYKPCEQISDLVQETDRGKRWSEFDRAFSELAQTRRLLTILGRDESDTPADGVRLNPQQHRVSLLAAIDDAAKCAADKVRENPDPKAKATARERLHAIVDFAWTLDNVEAGESDLHVRPYHQCAAGLVADLEGLTQR